MGTIKKVIIKSLKTVWRLTCSPISGAIKEISETSNHKSNNWKEWIDAEIRTYFAPVTGAYKGIRKELRQLEKKQD